jgi:hypothetical protein
LQKVLESQNTKATIIGGQRENVPGCTKTMGHEEQLVLENKINVKAIRTPCYTKGHTMYQLSVIGKGKPYFKTEIVNGY